MEAPRKIIVFLRAPDASAIAVFQDGAGALAREVFAAAIALSLCRIGPTPEGLPRRPDDPVDPQPPYDAAVIAVFEEADAARAGFDEACKSNWGTTPAVFLTSEILVLDRLPPGTNPAVKNLALIEFHDDLPDSAAQRSWAQHAKLATAIHLGAGRYVRNWVAARSAGAPPARGVVEIDFATLSDLTERYFGIPGGMERIVQDVGHFVARGTRLYMREERMLS